MVDEPYPPSRVTGVRARGVGRYREHRGPIGRHPGDTHPAERKRGHHRARPPVEAAEDVRRVARAEPAAVRVDAKDRRAVGALRRSPGPAHLEPAVRVGIHGHQLRAVGWEVCRHRPTRPLPGARRAHPHHRLERVEDVDPEVRARADMGLEVGRGRVRQRRVVADEKRIVWAAQDERRTGVSQVAETVRFDERHAVAPGVGIEGVVGIRAQCAQERDHAGVHVPHQDAAAREQRVVLEPVGDLGPQHHVGGGVLVQLDRVRWGLMAVLEQQVLVAGEEHATDVGVPLVVADRHRVAPRRLAECERVGGEEALEWIDARRQQAGGEDLVAVLELDQRSSQVAAVHQAPQPDHREPGLGVVEVAEAEEVVAVLVGDHPIDRAVEAVLALGLGDIRHPIDRPVERVREDHQVGVLDPERERGNVERAVAPDVALRVAAGVDHQEAVVAVPRNAVAERDRLGVRGEHHGAEHVDRRRVDVGVEHPRAEVGHVAHGVGAVLATRPHVTQDHGAAVGLHVVVALQRLEVGRVEVSVVGCAIDSGQRGVGARKIEVAIPGAAAALAVVGEIDPNEGDVDGVRIERVFGVSATGGWSRRRTFGDRPHRPRDSHRAMGVARRSHVTPAAAAIRAVRPVHARAAQPIGSRPPALRPQGEAPELLGREGGVRVGRAGPPGPQRPNNEPAGGVCSTLSGQECDQDNGKCEGPSAQERFRRKNDRLETIAERDLLHVPEARVLGLRDAAPIHVQALEAHPDTVGQVADLAEPILVPADAPRDLVRIP